MVPIYYIYFINNVTYKQGAFYLINFVSLFSIISLFYNNNKSLGQIIMESESSLSIFFPIQHIQKKYRIVQLVSCWYKFTKCRFSSQNLGNYLQLESKNTSYSYFLKSTRQKITEYKVGNDGLCAPIHLELKK